MKSVKRLMAVILSMSIVFTSSTVGVFAEEIAEPLYGQVEESHDSIEELTFAEEGSDDVLSEDAGLIDIDEEEIGEGELIDNDESDNVPIEMSEPDIEQPEGATAFVPRKTAPESGSKWYYTSENVYYRDGLGPKGGKGNCTWYAYGRASELLGQQARCGRQNGTGATKMAKIWYEVNDGYARGDTPRLGAVAWLINSDAGHVGVVEGIISNGNKVIISESWSSKIFVVNEYKASDWKYIYIGDFYENTTPAPTINSAQVSYIDPNNGVYRVTATITAPAGLDRVQFPTWTNSGGQDDLSGDWSTNSTYRGTVTDLGNNKYRAEYTVYLSAHNNDHGFYNTHIYAYDKTGRSAQATCNNINMYRIPVIEKVRIHKIDYANGTYGVSAQVSDRYYLDRVQFPTWTVKNGQDDLVPDWQNSSKVKGTAGYDVEWGSTYQFVVDSKDHNNERGEYITDVYAYDTWGRRCEGKRISFDLSDPGEASGIWGDNVYWKYADGTLSLTGDGDINIFTDRTEYIYDDQNFGTDYPWYPYIGSVERIVIGEGIEHIPMGAFCCAKKLKEVELPSTLEYIGEYAFADCTELSGQIQLPSSHNVEIEEGAFANTKVSNVVLSGNAEGTLSVNKPGETVLDSVTVKVDVDAENARKRLDCVWWEYYPIEFQGRTFHSSILSGEGGSFPEGAVIHYPSSWNQREDFTIDENGKWNGYTVHPMLTLKFDPANGSDPVIMSDIRYGSTVQLPEEPEYGGYTFEGWYYNDPDGNEISFKADTTVTDDLTVTAKWKAVSPDPSKKLKAIEIIGNVSRTLEVGQTDIIRVNVVDEGAAVKNRKWTSDNTGVLSVAGEDGQNKATVTALTPGTAVVNIVFDGKKASVAYKITEKYAPITSLAWNTETSNMLTEGVLRMTEKDHVILGYTTNPDANEAVFWESDNPGVASVDENGLVTAMSSGTASIILSSKSGNITAILPVEVTAAATDREIHNATKDIDDTDDIKAGDDLWIAGISASYDYAGKAIQPAVRVYYGDMLLREKTEYTISYRYNTISTAVSGKKAVVIIKGKGDYAGTDDQITFTINRTDLSKEVNVSAFKDTKGKVTVYWNGSKLKENKDYVVNSSDIEGIGNFSGKVGFSEYKELIPMAQTIITIPKSVDYTGSSIKFVSVNSVSSNQKISVKMKNSNEELQESVHYRLEYSNNVNAGTATVWITGNESAGYTGRIKKTFKINPFDISKEAEQTGEDKPHMIISMTDRVLYMKSGAKASPTVRFTDGDHTWTLREGVDYTLSFKDNSTKWIGVPKANVIIKGKGNYKGVNKLHYYMVTRKSIEDLKGFVPDIAANSRKSGNYFIGKPAVYDRDGKLLANKKDYRIVSCKANGKEISSWTKVSAGTQVTIEIEGVGGFYGTKIFTYQVKENALDMKGAVIKPADGASTAYTGAPVTPSLKVTYGKNKTVLEADKDYEIVGYYNNINRGTATVIISGKGIYSGSKAYNFKIGTKKMSLLKL